MINIISMHIAGHVKLEEEEEKEEEKKVEEEK